MSDYVRDTLGPAEEVLVEGRFPAVFWAAAWAVLFLLGPFLVGILIFAHSAARMRTTDFAVTTQRIVLKTGWISRSTKEIAAESVESVDLDQSFLGRLFNYGEVTVRGMGEACIAFPAMADPVTFRGAIERAREEAADLRLSEGAQAVLEDSVLTSDALHATG